jgi:hypothetical protein
MRRLILAALLWLFAFAVPAEAAAAATAGRAVIADRAAIGGLRRRPLPNGGGRLPHPRCADGWDASGTKKKDGLLTHAL